MNDTNSFDIHRRTFLRYGLSGLGLLGLNSLMADQQGSGAGPHGVINPLHYPAKAKRVIFLYQAGGPSHLETFDPKPKLAEMNGQPMPESITKGQQIAQLQGAQLKCFAPQLPFKKFGQNGTEICVTDGPEFAENHEWYRVTGYGYDGWVAGELCILRKRGGCT